MAQKKSDTAQVDDNTIPMEEEQNAGSLFVMTFWDQYEKSRERAETMRENREDAYLNAVKEVIKFNKQYRKSIANLYEQSKNTNKELVSEFMHQLSSDKEQSAEEVKKEAAPAPDHDREMMNKQLREVSGQLEKLALTPIKSISQLVEQLENTFEKNVESSIAFGRENRNAWLQVRKEYVKLARNTHLSLVNRGMNSFKELVK